MKKPIGTTYYLSQIRAFSNYKQGLKETAEQVLYTLHKIQAEIQILSPETPIYNNML